MSTVALCNSCVCICLLSHVPRLHMQASCKLSVFFFSCSFTRSFMRAGSVCTGILETPGPYHGHIDKRVGCLDRLPERLTIPVHINRCCDLTISVSHFLLRTDDFGVHYIRCCCRILASGTPSPPACSRTPTSITTGTTTSTARWSTSTRRGPPPSASSYRSRTSTPTMRRITPPSSRYVILVLFACSRGRVCVVECVLYRMMFKVRLKLCDSSPLHRFGSAI